MGGLTYQALLKRGYALLMGLFFMVSVSVVLMSLVTDVLYTLVDPRIRCFFVIVLALNLIGDGLNDALNPRLKVR